MRDANLSENGSVTFEMFMSTLANDFDQSKEGNKELEATCLALCKPVEHKYGTALMGQLLNIFCEIDEQDKSNSDLVTARNNVGEESKYSIYKDIFDNHGLMVVADVHAVMDVYVVMEVAKSLRPLALVCKDIINENGSALSVLPKDVKLHILPFVVGFGDGMFCQNVLNSMWSGKNKDEAAEVDVGEMGFVTRYLAKTSRKTEPSVGNEH